MTAGALLDASLLGEGSEKGVEVELHAEKEKEISKLEEAKLAQLLHEGVFSAVQKNSSYTKNAFFKGHVKFQISRRKVDGGLFQRFSKSLKVTHASK